MKNNIDNELDDELSKESINKENKEKERKLFASEIADRISENLKPLFANDNSEKIIEAIKENKPIVNVEPPIVKFEEKKHEIKMPDIKVKVPKTTINLKPNIAVKASDVKIPKIMEVRGFMDFAKLAMSVIKNKITIDASKEDPLPVQLVHDNKFYEAISGGGFSRVLLKNKNNSVINPATEDTLEILKDKFTVHQEHIKTIGFKEAIGHGVTDGNIKVERASGKKTGIGTGDFTLIQSYDFVQPSANTQMYLQSSSSQDSAAGTGIQLITIEYFSSAWGARKTVNVIPNGTNQVTISKDDIYRIHRIYGAEGHSAIGNITITNQATSILYGQIDENHTYMERCIFYVAEGETITCTEAILGSVTSGGVQIRLFATEEDADGNTLTRGRLPIEIVSGSLDLTFSVSESVYNPNNKRMSIGLVVKAAGTAANQSVTGALKGYRCVC